MKHSPWRRAAAALLVAAGALLSSCESNSGVGFSVGLPTSYGSMELGMSTTNWAGGPFWH
jgi:predicted small secreted protein